MPHYPYLLIHGLIGSLSDLVPLFAAHGRQAHAPDLLGYGRLQDAEPSCITLDGQVAHLAQWLLAHDIERVHLVGHSVGGAIAMLFAAAHPERVVSLVSVEGNFRWPTHSGRPMWRRCRLRRLMQCSPSSGKNQKNGWPAQG